MRKIDPTSPALRLVARAAMTQLTSLPPSERTLLLDGLASILPEKEAETAKHTAFLIRETERQQLLLLELLK